jgi:preprotein translocase subunit SecE
MAKNEAIGGLWTSLLSPGLYKRTQGKRVRQATAVLFLGWAWFGCWTLYMGPLSDSPDSVRVGIPAFLALISGWIAYRMVNVPQVADFLIAVEAEMKKISWPTIQRCFRAAAVVIVTMILLAVILFAYDQLWIWFFTLIKVLRVKGETGY